MNIKSKTFCHKLWESDHRLEAWKISRPYIKDISEIKIADLNGLDLSVQTLDTIGFHVKSTFYFRELLTSMRPHAIWTQSSRVNPIIESKISTSADEKLEGYMQNFLKQEFKSEKIDAERMKLPMGTLTEYVIALDFRSWISFIKFLEIYHPNYFAEYGLKILEELRRDGFDYETSKINPAFSLVNIVENNGEANCGPWTFVSTKIPINMRAQLIRHQDIRIVDYFMFKDEHDAESMLQDELIPVNIMVSNEKWKQIMSHRRCWIANFELYECFHKLVSVDDYIRSLPCKCKYAECPFKTDNESRKQGNDPNTPCPLSFNNYEEAESVLIARNMALGKSSGLEAFKQLIFRIYTQGA